MSNPTSTSLPVRPIPPQPISVLDVFLPGLTHAVAIAEQLLAGELSYYAYFVCLAGVLMYLSKYIGKLASWLEPYLTSTIHVKHSDETYDMLLTWVETHNISFDARSNLVRITKYPKVGESSLDDSKKALAYVPWEGSFWFWYGNHLISYRTKLVDQGFHKEEQISLTCLGRSSQILKTLMVECRKEYLAQAKSKTTIFEHRSERWMKTGAKSIRPLSTVILSEKEKRPLVDDIKEFLEPRTRKWYAERSLAYRRGYLLSGPPGTGKSSLCFSVAGEFDLDIYVISIPNMTDQTLKDLFGLLPEKCMVLLEDIDAVGVSRLISDSDDSDSSRRSPDRKPSVTLSGLLNTLDGVSSQEGHVVMMTTNHVEKLDEALIRPGRVDLRVEFGLADKDVIAQIFSYVYEQPEEVGKGAVDSLGSKGQAAQFAASVPRSTFSQAEILSYLLQHRNRPEEALRNCQAWVDSMLQRKAQLKRGDSWNRCD